MNNAVRKGFSFGLTTGIITTLGLIVGLNSSTHSKIVVMGGILIIAVADALSDSLGMHISEEAEPGTSKKEIWQSTIATFLTKLVIALTFIVPILLFDLFTAIVVSVVWGLALIAVFSYDIAKRKKYKPYRAILEHLAIAVVVIIVTHFLGAWVATLG